MKSHLDVYVAPGVYRREKILAGAQLRGELVCRHLGPPTGAVRDCPGCGGAKSVPLRQCAVHGVCTDDRMLAGVAWCRMCKNHEPLPAVPLTLPVTRNLAYHVYPRSGNGVWQWNVAQVRRRLGLFNGRRAIAVVTGPGLDPPDRVREAMAGERIDDWLELPNDPALREVQTFAPLLERVLSPDPGSVTFWGHAKGVGRPVNDGVTIFRWVEILYETLLDYPELVEARLRTHPIVGSMKKVGRGFEGSTSSWHYSGGFFWVRNLEAVRRGWRRIDRQWWGTEAWPGLHFRPEEAGVLFHEGAVPSLNMYDMTYLRVTVEPLYEQWRRDNARWRREP